MKLAFVPSAIPPIAKWAQLHPDDVWEALNEVEFPNDPKAETGRIDNVRLVHVDKAKRRSFAVGFDANLDADMVIVFVAEAGLMLDSAQRLAERLSRTNWSQHLFCLDMTGLEPSEFLPTLIDTIGALDLGEPVRMHPADVTVDRFIEQIAIHAQPWLTTNARSDFKGLMEAASDRPQKVNRPSGEEVYVVSKHVMESFSQPKSAAEIVRAFAERTPPTQIPLLKRQPPRGIVPLTPLRTSGETAAK